MYEFEVKANDIINGISEEKKKLIPEYLKLINKLKNGKYFHFSFSLRFLLQKIIIKIYLKSKFSGDKIIVDKLMKAFKSYYRVSLYQDLQKRVGSWHIIHICATVVMVIILAIHIYISLKVGYNYINLFQ